MAAGPIAAVDQVQPANTRRRLQRLRPEHLLLVLFSALLGVLRAIHPQPLSFGALSVRYALWMMVGFSALAVARAIRLRGGRAPGSGARAGLEMIVDWFPFVLCLWTYENLHDLTHWIRPETVDQALASADAWLFGVQPTLWLERWSTPLLTDWMATAYMSYFVTPPLLGGWLYLRGHVHAFRELQLAVLLAFYIGFVGYILVPAVGPQFYLAHQYRAPLEGVWVYWGAKYFIDTMQSFPRDCFPSLHTAVSTVVLVFAFRHRAALPFRRALLPAATVLTASLWMSTVYLRYHWVVDVFAGWALAAVVSCSGILLQRMWTRWTEPALGRARR